MNRLRFALTALVAAAALGGSLIATNVSAALLSGEEHGDAVASAAKTCPHKTASDPDIHGDCVSSIARMNHGHSGASEAATADSDAHGDAVSKAAHSESDESTSSDRDAHGDAVSAVAKKHPGH